MVGGGWGQKQKPKLSRNQVVRGRGGAADGTCWKENAARSGASAGKRKGRFLEIGKGPVTCYLERNRGSGERGEGGSCHLAFS